MTINGQTLTATPSAGAWSVTSPLLANATYPVVASVSDGAGNPGTATQQLTVDTVLPVVTLDGGSTLLTNDPTPTVSGTSDAAPGTIVHIAVGSQTLTALVQSGGTWNVTPLSLTDGTRTVTASVTDPAGNPGTASQTLTVDTTAPALTIAGGATVLTRDPTPDISGTASVAPGTPITITLADETLATVVESDGTWSVTASGLSDGPHRALATVSDAAGNAVSLTQTLTVDSVAPTVAITGGAAATTADFQPTITGTSDAPPGTIVTVSFAGTTMTTLVQADRTWNVTALPVAEGAWVVIASAPDPAGNLGIAQQILTVTSGALLGLGGAERTLTIPTAAPLGHGGGGGGSINAVAGTTISRLGRQKLGRSALSLGANVTASDTGRVVATARGTVKITGVRQAIMLTRTTVAVAPGRTVTLTLKPMGTARVALAAFARVKRAIAARSKVTATIMFTIADIAGNARAVRRTVILM